MATVKITLPRYKQSWDFSREMLRQTFPESLLSQALQEEPDVPEIIIDHPDVTPEALDVMANYMAGKIPSKAIPKLGPSERYLNLPELLPFLYPEYDLISSIVQNTGVWDSPATQTLLIDAVKKNDTSLLAYLLWLGVTPGRSSIRGIYRHHRINSLLDIAIRKDQIASFRLLFSDERVVNDTSIQAMLELAIQTHAYKIIQFLIEQKPDVNWWELIKLTLQVPNFYCPTEDLELLKLLRSQQDVNYADDPVLKKAIMDEKYYIFKWLLSDPGYRPYLLHYMDYIADTLSPSKGTSLREYIKDLL